jgi:ferredoxin-NADP reductase
MTSTDDSTKAATERPRRVGKRIYAIDRRRDENEIITSFWLRPIDGEPLPDYLPGQFMTFALPIPGERRPIFRSYSLSDSPHNADEGYRVSVKREPPPPSDPSLPPGIGSRFFHDEVDIGVELTAVGPRGEFHLDVDSGRPVVLMSGGVGLTPLVAMFKYITRHQPDRPVWFLHACANGSAHALGDEIRACAKESNAAEHRFFYAKPGAEDREGVDFDHTGFISMDLLKSLLPDADHEFYMCGPGPFMKAMFNGLLSIGVAEERIAYEFFGPATVLKEDGGVGG